MKYKCLNKRCGWKGDAPNFVQNDPKDESLKPYCPVCNYEVEEDVKKINTFKKQFEGVKSPFSAEKKDRLDRYVCAAVTGLLMKGKHADECIPSEALKLALKVIEEVDGE